MSDQPHVPGVVEMTRVPGDVLNDIRHDIAQYNRSYDRSQATLDKAHDEIDFLHRVIKSYSKRMAAVVKSGDLIIDSLDGSYAQVMSAVASFKAATRPVRGDS